MPVSENYFDVFGIGHKLSLDTGDLEKRYYDLSRKWHPDLFARRPPEDRREAEEATAIVNDAYRTLKDPIQRAEYFLKVKGFEPGKQTVPPDLLEEVFELNMALEEVRSGDEAAKVQLQAARTRFLEMRDEINRDLQALFAAPDESAEALSRIRSVLNRRNYVRNLVRDVEKALSE